MSWRRRVTQPANIGIFCVARSRSACFLDIRIKDEPRTGICKRKAVCFSTHIVSSILGFVSHCPVEPWIRVKTNLQPQVFWALPISGKKSLRTSNLLNIRFSSTDIFSEKGPITQMITRHQSSQQERSLNVKIYHFWNMWTRVSGIPGFSTRVYTLFLKFTDKEPQNDRPLDPRLYITRDRRIGTFTIPTVCRREAL